VFIATTNDSKPLRDRTGNRRFLPFYSGLPKNTTRLYNEQYWNEDLRNQCLAEALYYFDSGFNPMSSFSEEAKQIWEELNDKATIENDSLPIVEMYVNNAFPINFYDLSFEEMKAQWHERLKMDYRAILISRKKKDFFTIKEIYTIGFSKNFDQNPDYLLREQIVHALEQLGFVKVSKRKTLGVFGQVSQIYERVEGGDSNDISEEELPF
jgi:hypothetical protein